MLAYILSYQLEKFELFSRQAQKMSNLSINPIEPVNKHNINNNKTYGKLLLQIFSGKTTPGPTTFL